MKRPSLVIMAAGLGSRFGGNKQIAPVDEQGQGIIDYSVYDALRAGFGRIIFVIKPESEPDFRRAIGDRIARHGEVVYAYQTLDRLPEGCSVPEGRTKPWGTGHATLCASDAVEGAFAAINADDFYGAGGFRAAAGFLMAPDAEARHAMIAYDVENTLSESGAVSRGVCQVENGFLTGIIERTKVVARPGGAAYLEDGTETFLPAGTPVSMNLWAFGEGMMDELRDRFSRWLAEDMPKNPLKGEFYLPLVPNALIREGKARFRALRTNEKWFGLTYPADLPSVRESIADMKKRGLYPDRLWD
ncbi:MAG: NTP transferase domain-containing protein [Clostridia bacterium]|nr:NTP transferase domain-containing protein [Clostridia bacterium]